MSDHNLLYALLVAAFILIFFGPSELPIIGKYIDRSIKGFKNGFYEIDDEYDAFGRDAKKLPNQQISDANTDKPDTSNANHKEPRNG